MTTIAIELQPIGNILAGKEIGGVRWYDEQRCCEIHGPYSARVVFARGEKVSDGFCPECYRLQQEAAEKARQKALAQLEAEKERRRMEEALGRACIPDDFQEKTFDTFIADTPELEKNLSLAKRYANSWQRVRESGYGLYLFGNPGTGKSHLAISIIKALLPDITALYTRVPDMISFIRSTWHPNAETSSYEAIRHYINFDLLVLDEVGVQAGSINEQTLLFEVIDARLSENRPTIFLSNLKPSDLISVVGHRIVDRIKGKCIVLQFSGKSRRKPLTVEDVFGEAA